MNGKSSFMIATMKKLASLIIIIILIAFTGCGSDSNNKETAKETAKESSGEQTDSETADLADEQDYSEVTDLQLVLLNSVLYKDSLTNLEGELIEGHDELIDDKYKDNILGGNKLADQLKGYTLIDYDYGDITGFKAAAFTKSNNLVIVYGGTDHWTDFVDDIFGGLFDFSAQDGQAKAFAKDNVKKYRDYNLYITGYSLGGRLCYLGTEDVIDNGLGDNLKKVRTFNGLGVKEFIDFTDGNWSNIHNLQEKFSDKTYDYIVKGDTVSDEYASFSIKLCIDYKHIGVEFKVPCTNKIDTGVMAQHDLYSIIDYLQNNPPPAENASSIKNLNGKPVLVVSSDDYNIIGDISYMDGDAEVKTWSTFVSEYPGTADPMDQGREYFDKMHITLFFLKDNAGNVIDNKGVLNATGFGNDPCGWKDIYGEFEWMYTDTPETYTEDDFYILYGGEYYSGPAECHVVNAKRMEYVTFGTYMQSADENQGKEPIEWLILTQDDEKMLVVSRYCLDYLKYPDDWSSNISWENSSLRSYLNNEFIENAFTAEEQQEIILTENQNTANEDFYCTVDGNRTEDRVFLLSIDEVQKYLSAPGSSGSLKIAYGTDYLYDKLQSHYVFKEYGQPLDWALRADIDTSRHESGFGAPRGILVFEDTIRVSTSSGAMQDPNGPFSVVRPAMWIKNSARFVESNE